MGVFLDDIAAYIAAQTTGFDVFSGTTGNMVKAQALDYANIPDTVVGLYEPSGLAPTHVFSTGTGTRLWNRPTLQILSRSTSYQTARANAQTLYDLLDGAVSTTMNSNRYTSVDALSAPFSIGRDTDDRFLVSCNYSVRQDI